MADSTPSKKDVERWQLEQFSSLFPGFPRGSISDSEEPDFIVDTGDRKIGIELTDLYWQPLPNQAPRQSQESLWYRIVKAAERIYSESALAPLQVSVHFNRQYSLRKSDVARLAKAIAAVVVRNAPPPGKNSSEDYDWENRDYFPEEVITINVWNIERVRESFFNSPSAAFIPTLRSDDILRAMSLKESKVDRYRTRCDEVWLLVNCDGGQLSTLFEHDEAVIQKTYSSRFDRVFLMRHLAGKVYELKGCQVA